MPTTCAVTVDMPSGRTSTAWLVFVWVGLGCCATAVPVGVGPGVDGAIDGNKPAALPGCNSVLLVTLFRVDSGSGWIPIRLGAGSGVTWGVAAAAANCSDSLTARG
jgi:hypothetical protein